MLDVKGGSSPGKPDLHKVRERVENAQLKYKENADNRRRVETPTLQPGDFVRIKKTYKVRKGMPQY